MSRRLLLVFVVLALLCTAGTAQAARTHAVKAWAPPAGSIQWPVGSPGFNAALARAQAIWGDVAPPCTPAIAWFPIQNNWNAVTTMPACTISLNPSLITDWPKLCTILAHEWGHVLGHGHDDTVLMSAIYAGPVPECWA